MSSIKTFKQHLIKFFSFNYFGLLFGTILFCLSFLPSLLPRPWLYQALISSFSFVVGYGFGILISLLFHLAWQPKFSSKTRKIAWIILISLGLISASIYIILGKTWQNNVRYLVGEEPLQTQHIIKIVILSVLLIIILLVICRLIKLFVNLISNFINRFLPKHLSQFFGIIIISILLVSLFDGVIFNGFTHLSRRIYSKTNNTTAPGINAPNNPERSGSPASLVPWSTLGYQGRNFVATGPSQQQLMSFNNMPPAEPIRVYAGLQSAATTHDRAKLAVKELERTGAFSRPVLVVATATGTGWLEPQSIDSLEYIYNGNSAVATIQYSFLPSWISFLVDKQNATSAGQELFNAVYEKWITIPAAKRPKLIAYGLSLGSFGGQAAFSGLDDLKNRTDGALFMGTPNDTTLWTYFESNRDHNSPQWQPTYKNGKNIRFAAETSDFSKQYSSPWKSPHVVYMQHASDPVVWWSPNLLLKKPDWLNEKRGPDVSPTVRWFPFVTFAQVSVDQFFGVDVPNGHGHNYANSEVAAWLNVCPPKDGYNSALATRLQDLISNYSNNAL